MQTPASQRRKLSGLLSRRLLIILLLFLAVAAAWSAWQVIQIESTWHQGRAELARVSATPADVAVVLGSRAWEARSPARRWPNGWMWRQGSTRRGGFATSS